jgi:hypothetical protein
MQAQLVSVLTGDLGASVVEGLVCELTEKLESPGCSDDHAHGAVLGLGVLVGSHTHTNS